MSTVIMTAVRFTFAKRKKKYFQIIAVDHSPCEWRKHTLANLLFWRISTMWISLKTSLSILFKTIWQKIWRIYISHFRPYVYWTISRKRLKRFFSDFRWKLSSKKSKISQMAKKTQHSDAWSRKIKIYLKKLTIIIALFLHRKFCFQWNNLFQTK